MRNARITRHAIERYITRVDPSASPERARRCIQEILAGGKARSQPRHWMRSRVTPTPGLRYIYWAAMPNVCVLVLDGAAVTVLTRSLCRTPRFPVVDDGARPRRHRRPRVSAAGADLPQPRRVTA